MQQARVARKPSTVINRSSYINTPGTSLVVHWLRLRSPSAGGPGSIPGQGTRSRIPQLRARMQQLKDPACLNEDAAHGKEDPSHGKEDPTCCSEDQVQTNK